MQTVLGKIYKFNKSRGLLEKDFDYNRETGFLISEALELINYRGLEAQLVGSRKYPYDFADTHDELAKNIVNEFDRNDELLDKHVKFVDTFIDQFIFGAGALMKMGLPMGEIENMMHIVAEANLQKTGGTNEDGKQNKGTAFISPDEQLRDRLKLLPQFKGE